MNKLLLSLLGMVTVALFVWALMPADRAPVDTAVGVPSTTKAATDDAPSAVDDTPATTEAPARPAARAGSPAPTPAARPAAPTARPEAPTRLARPQLLPPLMPMPEGETKPPDQARWGRKGAGAMPHVDPSAVKASVRQYYGNLPRTGRMPGRINIDEVFPPAVYEALEVPPDSQLVELGPNPMTTPDALAEILEAPDGQDILGVTVVTPDGERIRDYIRLTDEPENP